MNQGHRTSRATRGEAILMAGAGRVAWRGPATLHRRVPRGYPARRT